MDPVSLGINLPGMLALIISAIIAVFQIVTPIATLILLWMIWRELRKKR